ncbi:MAG: hypothetical protein HY547_06085 [Elusimicrobia bacterium]|nr:hypothetical protein [Elusimicrobiota bacterium]
MFPIVFAHGFLGIRRAGMVEYFNGLEAHLKRYHRDRPYYFAQVEPAGAIEDRAQELKKQIRHFLKRMPKNTPPKAAIIGHSMGGLDARYLTSELGGEHSIAAVATVGTPHWGTPLTELIAGMTTWTMSQWGSLFGTRDMAHWNWFASNLAQPFINSLEQTSPRRMEKFNKEHPLNRRVRHLAYAGVITPEQPDFLPPVLSVPYHYTLNYPKSKAGGDNDGFISKKSALGQGLGFDRAQTIASDHFSQIGHGFALLSPTFGTVTKGRFDHLKFYDQVIEDIDRMTNSKK